MLFFVREALVTPFLFLLALSPATVAADCSLKGTTILTATEEYKMFESPNYPEPYPSKSLCRWLLVAPSHDYRLKIFAMDMDLEFQFGCIFDSVTIYDGNTTESAKSRRFCFGNFIVHSSGHYLLVVFRSDANNQYRGFKFRYNAERKKPLHSVSSNVIYGPTSEAPNEDKPAWFNTGIVIGGVLGGVIVIILLGIIIGRCLGSGRSSQPPVHRPAAYYHTHAPLSSDTPLYVPRDSTSVSTAVHWMQNNNSVFMVSQTLSGNLSQIGGGLTNMGFDGSMELPTGIAPSVGFLMPPVGLAPPPYCESMLRTNPPAIPCSPHPNPAPTPLLEISADATHQVSSPLPASDRGSASLISEPQPDTATHVEDTACAPMGQEGASMKDLNQSHIQLPPVLPMTNQGPSLSTGNLFSGRIQSQGEEDPSSTDSFTSSHSSSTATDSTTFASTTESDFDLPIGSEFSQGEAAHPVYAESRINCSHQDPALSTGSQEPPPVSESEHCCVTQESGTSNSPTTASLNECLAVENQTAAVEASD